MDATVLAWLILVLGYAAPLCHIALSPKSGPWRPPPGAGCPLGPRVGWLVVVVLTGPIGWLLYLRSRRARRRPGTGGLSS